jgi:hypothetical protein
MNTIFQQRDTFLNHRYFELTDSGLKMRYKSAFNSWEVVVKFEDLGAEVVTHKKGTTAFLICFLGASLLSIYSAMAGSKTANPEGQWMIAVTALGFLLAYLVTYERSLFLVKFGDRSFVEFFIDKPSRRQVDDYIALVLKQRNDVLLAKYGELNPAFPYDQNRGNQTWLLNNGVITMEEYNERIDALDLMFNKPVSKIGFEIGEN